MKTCVFAGTFDPFTKGHEYVVEKCLELFDKVIIAVGVNVDKTPLFSQEQRVNSICSVYGSNDKVEVCSYSGMLVDFMKEKGVKITVRGIRNQDDYKYETTMAHYNQDMFPEIITVYIPTPVELTYVSSTAIRNIIELNGEIKDYVPQPVATYLKSCLEKNKSK